MTTTVVNPTEPIDYSSAVTPSSYVCGGCGKSGVKLWRDFEAFLDHQTLSCVDCAGWTSNIDTSMIGDDGKRPSRFGYTDQIGWHIPAIPTTENDTFWGYSSVPQDGCDWWDRLPIR